MNTNSHKAAALILSSLLCASSFAATPLQQEKEKMAGQGFALVRQATARLGPSSLVVHLYAKEGGGREYLRVFLVSKSKAKLVFLEPGFSKNIRLDPVHKNGLIPDLLRDGSRVLAYHETLPAVGQETLVLLRYSGGGLARLADLPYGRLEDLDAKGPPEVVSRSRPLGQFFQIECESFHSMAQSAFRTTVHAFREGRLVPVSKEFPRLYEDDIRALEAGLSSTDPRKTQDYGGFLGSALSLYFDYEELGKGKEGWGRFRALFEPHAGDSAVAKRCLGEMETELKTRLGIPPDW
ncbi:MAG: hypothetical protein WC728_10000 [Elusimicrobiota bacterium]